MIVVCGYDWSEIVRSIAWEDSGGVMLRILADDRRSTFDRRSTSPSLAAELEMTSSYFFRRAIRVNTVAEAWWLLGNPISVLDLFTEAHLAHEGERLAD